MSNESLHLGKFVALVVQLFLLLLLIRQFQLESPAFHRLLVIAWSGFAIQYFLPTKFRLPFFLFLSLFALVFLLGPVQGAWIIGLGAALVGVCHLPLSFAKRVVLLVLVASGLAVVRAGWVASPLPMAVWPILGSMFMFRLIVYLYDLRHDRAPVSWWHTFSYFFLLPNVCFPFFPVVDYSTMRRNYNKGERHDNYQTGVRWMFRGVTHLIRYRFVYQHLAMDPSRVRDLGDVVICVVSAYALYLRISGQFHLIVGMLHLFGFKLPETNHLYFLSSSFTDFWRRINIYWKDFMMKVFYYPAFFQLRKLGNTPALVLSTLLVFFATWFFHAYQWFWIRGGFVFSWNDTLFWTTFALLVVANTLFENHYASRRTATTSFTFGNAVALVLRTAATFTTIAILWSLWTSESISAWLALWEPTTNIEFRDSRFIPLFAAGVVLFIGATLFAAWRERRQTGTAGPAFSKSVALNGGLMCIVLLSAMPSFYNRLGPRVATVMNNIRADKLNRQDTKLLELGYYEDLLAVNRFNSQLWEVYMNRPLDWFDLEGVGAVRPTGDFLERELPVSREFYDNSNVLVRTNRLGMRDREYADEPPTGVFRIAMVGSSWVMGMGVEQDATFEALLEERLNREAFEPWTGCEVLNFGVSAYAGPQHLVVIEKKALPRKPHVVIYDPHGIGNFTISFIARAVERGTEIPYKWLREFVAKAGIDRETSNAVAVQRLMRFQPDIIASLLREMASDCREHGATPVLLNLYDPLTESQSDGPDVIEMAQAAGFILLDLSDWSANHQSEDVLLAEWNRHPNALGHKIIADLLFDRLLEVRDKIGLSPPITTTSSTRLEAE
ncbi:MAG: SGNH/GDSL hydrolase family protein [Pirellulaceae bacterium]